MYLIISGTDWKKNVHKVYKVNIEIFVISKRGYTRFEVQDT